MTTRQRQREYELVYHSKERAEDVLANTPVVPLRPFGRRRGAGRADGDGWQNLLIFGDNLPVLQTLLGLKKAGRLGNEDGTAGCRLIYIDPPFASRQEFRGADDRAAYGDHLAGADFLRFLWRRLVLLRELLSDDGTIYVHVDWKKSHYVRVLLDEVFGEQGFLNEIIWHFSNKYGANSDAFDSFHNTLYRYARGRRHLYRPIRVPVKVPRRQPLRRWNKALNKNEWLRDAGGNYLYQDSAEKDVGDVWDIPVINPMARERLGYPTQKPEALLDRLIRSSSDPGDLVLDAFAGSGTTCAVAEKLGRRWVGIDNGHLAIATTRRRLRDLRGQIGNRGPKLEPAPFLVYRAGPARYNS
jgi:site-specific DNA-methyltransferase (adenine-specific)/adenine-specific DNA-methyltransferase